MIGGRLSLSHKSHQSHRACRSVVPRLREKADPIRYTPITVFSPRTSPITSHLSLFTSHSFQPLKLEALR